MALDKAEKKELKALKAKKTAGDITKDEKKRMKALKAKKKDDGEDSSATKRKAEGSDDEAAEAPAKKAKAEEPSTDGMKVHGSGGGGEGGLAPNPDGIIKVFCGNLSYDIDDDKIKEFFKDCGEVTFIRWLTDKETGNFYGSGFIEFDSADGAAKAVGMAGQDCMGRPLKCQYAKPREGEAVGGRPAKKPFVAKEISARPDNCTTVFMGNLSFDIDDDVMKKFAEGCGDVKAIRWLTDRESGQFKGCGFVEFFDESAVDAIVKKNGETLMGRPVRIDYSAPRAR